MKSQKMNSKMGTSSPNPCIVELGYKPTSYNVNRTNKRKYFFKHHSQLMAFIFPRNNKQQKNLITPKAV
jgi:hypothetical protein